MHSWRIGKHVIDLSATGADAATSKSFDQFLPRYIDGDDCCYLFTARCQGPGQRVRLGTCAGKAVVERAFDRGPKRTRPSKLVESLVDERDRQLIRYQLSAVGDSLNPLTQFRPAFNSSPKQFSRGNRTEI